MTWAWPLPCCRLPLLRPDPSSAATCPCCLQAFWALLLDLLTCPAPAAAVLPPLAAALDVWPSLLEPAAADRPGGGGLSRACVHAALQRLCSAAAAGEEEAAGQGGGASPPPLLPERQPAAASLFLRRLGQRVWGWAEGAAGDGEALRELKAALAQPPGGLALLPHAAPGAPQAGVVPRQASPPPPPPPPPAVAAIDRHTEHDDLMEGVEQEEI